MTIYVANNSECSDCILARVIAEDEQYNSSLTPNDFNSDT
jgi:hypothetical protein